ncbi:hypothetical protein [Streptomyces rubiginosohelvolus]|uniref:hypothetical protein n=1 Tax=Streptomyces rubiginosohelvolus TaxID=67362 RepID=UPI0035DF88D4
MSHRHTAPRAMQDLGLAVWFGGSLITAVGPRIPLEVAGGSRRNGARISTIDWSVWTPVRAAAIAAYLIGSSGLQNAKVSFLLSPMEETAFRVGKSVLTGAALATTAFTRVLSETIEIASSDSPEDVGEAVEHPVDPERALRCLAAARWALPVLTGGLIVLNALRAEQQLKEKL